MTLEEVVDALVRTFTILVPKVQLAIGQEVEFDAVGIETVDSSGAFVPAPGPKGSCRPIVCTTCTASPSGSFSDDQRFPASAGTLYASVLPRRVTSANDYRCKIVGGANGSMQLVLVRRVSSAETTIGSSVISGLTLAANQTYNVACRTAPSGNATQVTGKLWRTGTAEPASWQVSATDSAAALQANGGIGVSSYLSSGATPASHSASMIWWL